MSIALSSAVLLTAASSFAANHREAPLTALDHKVDITDWFAFVSYDDRTKVTMILAVDPLLEPSNGPNYFPFDPEILYEMKIDNNQDARPDITFQFRFTTETRLPCVFTGFVGAGNGISAPSNSPPPVAATTPIVPPAITALDGPDSKGLSLRQKYTVRMIKGGVATDLGAGRTLIAVPSNVGPRTMPNYDDLARKGIYELGNGIRVFAGTADDPFYIALGAAFDTLNFYQDAYSSGVAGVLSDAQDAQDGLNFAADDVSGFNVNVIAIEVPISLLTSDGQYHTGPAIPRRCWGPTARPRARASRCSRSNRVAPLACRTTSCSSSAWATR